MKLKTKSIISLLLCLVLAVASFTAVTAVSYPEASLSAESVSSTSTNDYGLLDEVEGGLILHCWCWSFNTIKNNMESIAQAGYTAVQTSPISKCIVGEGGGMQLSGNGKWYYHYQPVAYTIGNYQLGTEAEFKAMCDVAHSYGVKVIVDVVANHCTGDYGSISDSVKNISGGAFHNNNGGIDYRSREKVTQNDLNGLKDLNTQNPNVQQMILNFLRQAVSDGADGFRYDAAKHIELPDDGSFGGNFWPVVLDNGSSFQYGEILQDYENGTDRFAAYADYMHVTASSYGYIVREALMDNNLSAAKLGDLANVDVTQGVSSDRLVGWVESHDTYANEEKYNSSDTSFWLENQQIRQGWAVVAAQGGMSALFFSRPSGSSPSNRWGNNRIGDAGDSNYYNSEVTAVNHFHNALHGLSYSMENIDGDKSVLMISRESSGVVIINSSSSDLALSCPTELAEGSYNDEAHGSTFTSSGGVLTGTVKAGEIAVLYRNEIVRNPSVSISFNGGNQGGGFYDSATVTLKSNYTASATYTLGSASPVSFISGDTVTFGDNMAPGESVTLTLNGTGENGATVEKSYSFTKLEKPRFSGTTCVYYDNSKTGWDSVYVYAYTNNGASKNNQWPGVVMTDIGNDIWAYAVDESWSNANVIFSDNGNDQTPAPNEPGYTINRGESKILSDSWMNYSDFTAAIPTSPATVPTPTVTQQPATQRAYLYGDANLDGSINVNDATLIQKHTASIASISGLGYTLADVNGDNRVNIKDASCLQKYSAGIMNGIGNTGRGYGQ